MIIQTSGVKPSGDYYMKIQWDAGDDTKTFVYECGPCPEGRDMAAYAKGIRGEIEQMVKALTKASPEMDPLPFDISTW